MGNLSMGEAIAASRGNGGHFGLAVKRGIRQAGGLHGLGQSQQQIIAMAIQASIQRDAQDKQFVKGRVLPYISAEAERAGGYLRDAKQVLYKAEAMVAKTDDPGAFGLVQQVSDAVFSLESIAGQIQSEYQAANDKVSNPVGPNPWTIMRPELEQYYSRVKSLAGQASKAASAISGVAARVKSVESKLQATAQVAAQQAAAAAAAEQRRLDLEAQRQREEREAEQRAEQLRWEREEALRAEERRYQEQLMAAQRAEQERLSSEREAARQAELQFQQQLLQMQQDREAREQEWKQRQIEREEAREARREEQEAMLQQLFLQQELGPQPGQQPGALPPGYMYVDDYGNPVMPGGGMPGPGMMSPYGYPAIGPTMAPMPGLTQFAPSPMPMGFQPYGGQQFGPTGPPAQFPVQGAPGTAQTMPVSMAPQPAPMPTWQQSQGIRASQPMQSPFMQPAAFSPGAELFGLGAADQLVTPQMNPATAGAQIERGYRVYGPFGSAGTAYFTFERPDGARFNYEAKFVTGEQKQPITDPETNAIIFVPAPEGYEPPEKPFDYGKFTSELSKILSTAGQVGVSAYAVREKAKAEERIAKAQAAEAQARAAAIAAGRQPEQAVMRYPARMTMPAQKSGYGKTKGKKKAS